MSSLAETHPLVAIRCITYNHKPYIRDCLDGFVMQQTNFPFVAIVHDDCSTDGTADIIREYAEKYPDIIKPIYESENQYSKHDGSLDRIMTDAIDKTRAKYIALCEGDDYWTDPHKLQRQVDFMEAHPEYSAAAENGIVHHLSTNEKRLFSDEPTRDITSVDELILKRRFPTASVLYRANLIGDDFYLKGNTMDTMLWCYLCIKGRIRYVDVISSVYRRGSGVTETLNPYKWAQAVESLNKSLIIEFGEYYDINISYQNIYDNYWGCSLRAWSMRDYKTTLKCLSKCLKIAPIKTIYNSISSICHKH